MSITVDALTPDNPRQLETFRRYLPQGVELIWVDSTQPVEQQATQLKDAVAVIAAPSAFSVDLALACPNLKLIQTVSAGTNTIDLPALDELGIKVANNGGGNAVAVAEHSIALMVSVYRNLKRQFQSVQDRQWAADIRTTWFPNAYELTDKIVGIIGLGRIGQQVARRLQGWDCRLIYHDVTSLPTALEKALNITKVDFDELLRTSDMITLHVPLSRLTKGMMNDRAFDLMKPTAVLIFAVQNVARVASGEEPQSVVNPV